jgi:uncharacterized protein DUF2510
MAYEVDAHGPAVKVRSPYVVTLLVLFTLGFYGLAWYHRTNSALRRFGEAYDDPRLGQIRPLRATLAMFPGFLLIVPPFISLGAFVGNVRRAETLGRSEVTSGFLVTLLLLTIILIPAVAGYIQAGLTQLWRRYPRRLGEPLQPGAAGAGASDLRALPPPEPWVLRGSPASRRLARTWFWLRGPEDPPANPPREGWFRPWVAIAGLVGSIAPIFAPMPFPLLGIVISAVFAVQVHYDRRAQGLAPFWWASAAGTFGGLGFLAYTLNRRETIAVRGQPVGRPRLPAGLYEAWYPDPLGKARFRWWTGSAWSGETA